MLTGDFRVEGSPPAAVLHRREQGVTRREADRGAKALALHIVRYGGERRGRHGKPFDGRRLSHDLPATVAVVTREREKPDAESPSMEASSSASMMPSRQVHRRGKEEMPGEDPLFRQLPAGDTGDGGRHSSLGVVGAEAHRARQVPVTRCQGGGTGGA